MKRALLVLAVVVSVALAHPRRPRRSPPHRPRSRRGSRSSWTPSPRTASIRPGPRARSHTSAGRCTWPRWSAEAAATMQSQARLRWSSCTSSRTRRPASARSPTPWPTPRAARSRPACCRAGTVARAQNDGADAVWTGTPPVGPGFWIPTPPAYVYPPLEPLAGTWRTWNVESGSQLRPGPPPAYGSAQFLAEMNEVYSVSLTLTEEQKRIADYWADGAGTVTPPGHWNVIALDLLRTAGWPTLRTARLFATLNTAQADAFISCWDTKYAYWSLRPVTAIRRLIDPTWSSYIVTPPFPSYTSGHSTTSGAASTVLAAFFPGKAAICCHGRGGRTLASVRRHPLRDRQRGRAHGRTAGRKSGRPRLPHR